MNKLFKRITGAVASAAMLGMMTACGGGNNTTFSVENQLVLGDDVEYVGIVPGSKAKVSVKYEETSNTSIQKFSIHVKLRLQKKLDIVESVKVSVPESYRLEVVDQDNYLIGGEYQLSTQWKDDPTKEKLEAFLQKDEGAEEEFTFHMEMKDKDKAKELMKNYENAKGVLLSHFKFLCNGQSMKRLPKVYKASGFAASDFRLEWGLDGNVEVLDGAKVSVGENGHPQVTVTLKKVHDFVVSDYTDDKGRIVLAAYAYDTNGNSLVQFQDLNHYWENSESTRIKAFLKGKIGETATFTFSAAKGNGQNGFNSIDSFMMTTFI